MHVLFFGTFDEQAHPRVRSLREGFERSGHEVTRVNLPLGLPTSARVQIARQPWRAPALVVRLARIWRRLWRAGAGRTPDVVVVGYLGHFDVHLARRRFPRSTIVLDHMVSLGDTAQDRGLSPRSLVTRLLTRVDRAAVRAADVVLVDTAAQGASLERQRATPKQVVVVPVAPPLAWFEVVPAPDPADDEPVRVVFFGLYTPLQGTPTIGEALRILRDAAGLEVTMIGTGQEYDEARSRAEAAGRSDWVEWIDWVDDDALPRTVADHHVCLGIFGTTAKAQRVVPNKVLQGAAAGCAVVTSSTPPQVAWLGDAGRYVPAGDAAALAAALRALVTDRAQLARLRHDARRVAQTQSRPETAVAPLLAVLGAPQVCS